MNRESIENFIKFISEDKERKAKAKSFAGDMDAISAYAKESGYDVSPEDFREYQERSLQLLKSRVEKAQQTEVSLRPGVREFYALMDLAQTDKEVEKRLEELSAGTQEELIAYGREKGFTFNGQDLQAVGKDTLEPSDELNDEELELVAGGTTLAAVGVGAMVVLGVGLVAAVVMFAVRR